MAKVHGVKDMQAKWSAVPRSVEINVRAVLEEIADELVQQMFSQAPQDTGDLAGAIGWTWGDVPTGSVAVGNVAMSEDANPKITVYAGDADTFYARFVEFGTQKMPAQPFFFPVWRANRRRVRSKITKSLKKAIREA